MAKNAAIRRLPGIEFQAQPPAVANALPRMDVAAFVGFAAAGPLHVPVPIEHAARYEEIFGGDFAIATDADSGDTVWAHLGPAVRAFLRNGGRRCWIVRVGDEKAARKNRFPVPGLAVCDTPAGAQVRMAVASARSEGSWSDGLRVGAAVAGDGLQIVDGPRLVQLQGGSGLEMLVRAPLGLVVGDLLEVAFGEIVAYAPVDELSDPAGSQDAIDRQDLRVRSLTPIWLQSGAAIAGSSATAAWERGDGETTASAAAPAPASGGALVLELGGVAAEDGPRPGTLVRLSDGTSETWLAVADLHEAPDSKSCVVSGTLYRASTAAPASVDLSLAAARRLSLSLSLSGEAGLQRLEDLGFCPAHPRFWGALPDDAALFDDESFAARPAAASVDEDRPASLDPPAAGGDPYADLFDAASTPRFALAGGAQSGQFFFPLGMAAMPEGCELGPAPAVADELVRTGLGRFGADLFLDEALEYATSNTLLGEADFVRYQSPAPRALRGIHSVLSVGEATLVAVPDAVQAAWKPAPPRAPPAPAAAQPAAPPEPGTFRDCSAVQLAAPVGLFSDRSGPEPGQPFTLFWQAVASADAYAVFEATRPDFAGEVEIGRGPSLRLDVYGRDAGTYYYRVRAFVGDLQGPASAGVVVRVQGVPAYVVHSVPADASALLAVQRALLRMCGARGDLFATLSLPRPFREDDAIAHAALLAAPFAPSTADVPPLGYGEQGALSYGGLYHPWVVASDEARPDVLRLTPPDGAAIGVVARRTIEGGAWIAPANEPWRGIVALDPPVDAARLLDLQDARLNVVRQEPRGFVVLAEQTLSPDIDLGAMHVRRLLALLKRAALQLGPTYVFEPNDASFRRGVQRGFEALLATLFKRGAFAGATRETSYQVNAGPELNTPQAVDAGRFFVELKVAPAAALRFLVVRLVQGSDLSVVTEER